MCKDCKSSIIINYNYVCVEPNQRKGKVKWSFVCGSYIERVKPVYVRGVFISKIELYDHIKMIKNKGE